MDMLIRFLENIVLLMIVAYVLFAVVRMQYHITKSKNTLFYLKIFFSTMLMIPIFISCLIGSMTTIISIGYVFQETASDSYLVREFLFLGNIFFFNIIGIVAHDYIYKTFVFHQLIPGKGCVKVRLSNLWLEFKKSFKKKKSVKS